MNEISLEVKAKEKHENAIGYLKIAEFYCYKFIMEIKDIRESRLYKQLGYSNFNDYCKIAWGVERRVIDERIQTALTFEENFESYNSRFGHRKMLILTQMEEEEREKVLKEGIKTEKGIKTIEEVTQQELTKYKNELKKEREKNLKLEKEKNDIDRQYKELANKPPKVITEIKVKENRIEVMSKEKEQQLRQYEKDVKNYQSSLNALKEQKDKLEKEVKKYKECDQLDAEKRKLEIEKHISIFDLQIKIKKFLEDSAPSLFLQGAIASSDLLMKKELLENIKSLELFVKNLKDIISTNIEFEDAEYKEVN